MPEFICNHCHAQIVGKISDFCNHIKGCQLTLTRQKTKKRKYAQSENRTVPVQSIIDEHFGNEGSNQIVNVNHHHFYLRNTVAYRASNFFYSFDKYRYIKLQLKKFELSFTHEHILARNWDEFINMEMVTEANFPLSQVLKFYSFVTSLNCNSVKDEKRILKYINKNNPGHNGGYSWNRTKRLISEHSTPLILRKEFPYPSDWNVQEEPIKLEVLDLLEWISLILIDPIIQCQGGKFHTRSYDSDSNGMDHLFCSEWAKQTQLEIDKSFIESPEENIFIAMIFYEDGVSVSKNGDRSIDTLIGTLGNFSKKLNNRSESKFTLGYFPKVPVTAEIIAHNKKISLSKAVSELKMFKLKLHRAMYQLALEPLRFCNANGGILMRQFGKSDNVRVHLRVPFVYGDIPAIRKCLGLYLGQCNRGCSLCLYPNRDCRVTYDAKVHDHRNFSLTNKYRRIVEDFLIDPQAYASPVDRTVKENVKNMINNLASWSVHPLVSPFDESIMGTDNSIFNSPCDILHVMLSGIVKSTVIWSLLIVQALSRYSSSDLKGLTGKLENNLKNFPRVWESAPHVQWTYFRTGLSGKS